MKNLVFFFLLSTTLASPKGPDKHVQSYLNQYISHIDKIKAYVNSISTIDNETANQTQLTAHWMNIDNSLNTMDALFNKIEKHVTKLDPKDKETEIHFGLGYRQLFQLENLLFNINRTQQTEITRINFGILSGCVSQSQLKIIQITKPLKYNVAKYHSK